MRRSTTGGCWTIELDTLYLRFGFAAGLESSVKLTRVEERRAEPTFATW
jgi:hypothetical protein